MVSLIVDATVKCAFEHGFRVIVPVFANSTVDNSFMTGESGCRYYNEFMCNGRYADVSLWKRQYLKWKGRSRTIELKMEYRSGEHII